MISSACETTSQTQSLFAKMNTVYPYTNSQKSLPKKASLAFNTKKTPSILIPENSQIKKKKLKSYHTKKPLTIILRKSST